MERRKSKDLNIPWYELYLLKEDLSDVRNYILPENYHFSFYKTGDREKWIEIEKSVEELDSTEQGIALWTRFFGHLEEELSTRMVFLENENHEKIGTASAIPFTDENGEVIGRLSWVAIRPEYQGRGLAKPLISRALQQLREWGYTKAIVHTQTVSWVAVKLYLEFGFLPTADSLLNCPEGWKIMKDLTAHPALKNLIC